MATISVKCRFCGLTDPVKKHGTGNGGHPRYRCQACCRTFQVDYTYNACQPGIKEQVVELAMNNAGIRDTAREGANKSYGTRASTGNPLILND
ncbi:IS1 family transposase [Escherichia coli]|nr:IS1 family transposase [Escherichia coli]VVX77511.1 Transposase and inactivated derivatives [Escherichia coli]VVX77525.1 Transposase and inactivated derivatives [Escherichia coli]VVX77545.1 Transposase and inactivated derivatives [Escherichia coli]VVX83248.1 Transposase and inactivated derivatives [Escherichia coli]